MTERALILAPFDDACLAELGREMEVDYESWLETRLIWDPEELGRRINREGKSILVVEIDFVFEELFEEADGLKFVGVCHAALNHVEVDAATRHGVVVVNTHGRTSQAVAEHVLGLMLALARRIPEAHAYTSGGRWQDPTAPYREMRGVELAGRTVGIVGLGAIGHRLAEIARAIGMKVVGHDPYAPAPDGVEPLALDDLLQRADFVSLHVPPTEGAAGLLDERRIGMMKQTAYLINTASPAAVDEPALVEALRSGAIAGAAIDVFESHPVPPSNPLLGLDNVVLTPHIGGATEETVRRQSVMITGDIRRWMQGKRPKRLANPEVWDRRA